MPSEIAYRCSRLNSSLQRLFVLGQREELYELLCRIVWVRFLVLHFGLTC